VAKVKKRKWDSKKLVKRKFYNFAGYFLISGCGEIVPKNQKSLISLFFEHP
jgi:hypothetical protein